RADLTFSTPQFLPGDALPGGAAGMQVEADVALGNGQYLAVWSDGRTTPEDYDPFATEGSGTDIYATRLDAAGNPIETGALMVNQQAGDQIAPRVAWNGENWLVIWRQTTTTLPPYEEVLAARVAPDGTLLDTTPIVVHREDSYYTEAIVEGADGEWLVLFQHSGTTDDLRAVRVLSDGTVANPGGLAIHTTNFLMDFDVVFSGTQYLIVWAGPFDAPRARRYTPDLQIVGTSTLPFARRVATDGTDFLVVHASGPPPNASVAAVTVSAAGVVGASATLFTAGNQSSTHGADVVWDGTHYWVSWNGNRMGRVTSSGQVLEPGGFDATPGMAPVSLPAVAPVPTGGVQLVYNDGVSGADYPKDVYGGRVTPARLFTGEVLLSRGAGSQTDPEFAVGQAGVNVVVHLSRNSGSGRILAHRIDDSGAALDLEPIEVATGPMPGLGVPTLGPPAAAWNGSVFLVTWSDGVQVYARRMQPDGTFLDATPLVVMDGHDPDVDAVGSVFLVAAIDLLSGNPQWQATHTMRVDGATGANLDAQPNALGGFLIFARHPRVVSWGDRWLVVWQRNISHDNPAAGTTAAIVLADGTTPGPVDVPVGWRPDVAVAGDRALIVAVTGTIASATNDLHAHLIADDGSLIGTPFQISGAFDKQLRPTVTWNGVEFVAAWEDKRGAIIYYDERTDLYGARVALDGTVLDPSGVAIATDVVPEGRPALASIGGETLLAASTFRADPSFAAYRITVQRTGAATAVPDVATPAAGTIRLLGVRPNPVVAATTIRFALGSPSPVSLEIYDAGGRKLRTLLDGEAMTSAATHVVPWDGRDAAGRAVGSGVYFYRVRTGHETVGGKVVVRR
ncbi:MAG: T9SS type A sorting domain-containing protein, partial [Gemmatimonadetes bacterium]|nr:T9SS type A sorting domain-containing protein [Gemmatimonadota bacterium]